MDFSEVREKMDSEEGIKLLSKLNNLSIDIKDLEQSLNELRCLHFVRSQEYKQFLGYPLTDKEFDELEQARKDLEEFQK